MYSISAVYRLRQFFAPIFICGLGCGIVHSQFSTVITVPPNSSAIRGIDDGTQLNVLNDGFMFSPFTIGEEFGTHDNLEVNVRGGYLFDNVNVFGGVVNLESGSIGSEFTMWPGSELNVTGGMIGSGLSAEGATLNVYGGKVGGRANLRTGTKLTIDGGDVGTLVGGFGASVVLADGTLESFRLFDSNFTMTGGTLGDSSAAYNTQLTISGGKLGDGLVVGANSSMVVSGGGIGRALDLVDGGELRLVGNDFRFDGQPVIDFDPNSNVATVNVSNDYRLTGTLADGTPFLLSSLRGSNFGNGKVLLEAVELPLTEPGTHTVSSESALAGVRAGQIVEVVSGGVLGTNFHAGREGTLNVHRNGSIANFATAVGAIVNVNGGRIGNEFHAFDQSRIRLREGWIGNDFLVGEDSVITVEGGRIGEGFTADNSAVSVMGGVIGSFSSNGSHIDVDGGRLVALTAVESDVSVRSGVVHRLMTQLGTQLTVSGGEIETLDLIDSTAEFHGGAIGELRASGESSSSIERGRVAEVWIGKDAEMSVSGGQFNLDGIEIDEFSGPGDVYSIEVPVGSVFSGVLADGVPFRWDTSGFRSAARIQLTAVELPAIEANVVVALGSTSTLGSRGGQRVDVQDGGKIPNYFIAVGGSTVNVAAGGVVGDDVAIVDSSLVSKGRIGDRLTAVGSSLEIGGTLGGATVAASSLKVIDSIVDQGLVITNGSVVEVERSSVPVMGVQNSEAYLKEGADIGVVTVGLAERPDVVSRMTMEGGSVLRAMYVFSSHVDVHSGVIGDGQPEERGLFHMRESSAGINEATILTGMEMWGSDVVVKNSNVSSASRLRLESTLLIQDSDVDGMDVRSGSVVTMLDGILGIENPVSLSDGGKLVLRDGQLNNLSVQLGGTVEIHGGNVGDDAFFNSGSTAILSGGKYGSIRAGRSPERLALVGREFQLDGVAIEGLPLPGSEATVDLGFGSVLSGTFANGTPFAFSRQDGDLLPRSMTIVLSEPILPGPDRIVASIDELPEGLNVGTLVVDRGGELPENFNVGTGTHVEIQDGGVVGANFEVVGATVEIDGGIVGAGFDAFVGSNVTISGGRIGDRFNAHAGSVVELVGDRFLLNGEPIETLVGLGDSLILEDRMGSLTGQFSDGMPFEFALDSVFFVEGMFHPNATLRLTLSESNLNCDFDKDGECQVNDIDALLGALGGPDLQFDLDGSGAVESADVAAWLFKAGARNVGRPYVEGDVTLDGVVDQADLNVLGLNWQADVTGWGNGDFNGDGIVDAADLSRLGENWSGSSSVAAVPEPDTLVMRLFSLVFFGIYLRTVRLR